MRRCAHRTAHTHRRQARALGAVPEKDLRQHRRRREGTPQKNGQTLERGHQPRRRVGRKEEKAVGRMAVAARGCRSRVAELGGDEGGGSSAELRRRRETSRGGKRVRARGPHAPALANVGQRSGTPPQRGSRRRERGQREATQISPLAAAADAPPPCPKPFAVPPPSPLPSPGRVSAWLLAAGCEAAVRAVYRVAEQDSRPSATPNRRPRVCHHQPLHGPPAAVRGSLSLSHSVGLYPCAPFHALGIEQSFSRASKAPAERSERGPPSSCSCAASTTCSFERSTLLPCLPLSPCVVAFASIHKKGPRLRSPRHSRTDHGESRQVHPNVAVSSSSSNPFRPRSLFRPRLDRHLACHDTGQSLKPSCRVTCTATHSPHLRRTCALP